MPTPFISYRKLLPAVTLLGTLLPLLAFGQDLADLFDDARAVLNFVIIALFTVATVIFLWGVVKYILYSQDEKARESAKAIMTWGIVGLIIMVAVWGIVLATTTFFGVGDETVPIGPVVPVFTP